MKAYMRSLASGFALGVVIVLFSFSLIAAAETSSSSSSTATQQTESTCTQGGGKWCKNSDGATGWCTTQSATCPANDQVSCKTQGGQWCTSSGSGYGWCSTSSSGCPISDETTCTAKGYVWCKGNASGSSGWCSTDKNYHCPANDEASCKTQGGQWCKSTASGTASTSWCAQNGATCPANDESSCTSQGRSWCKYQSGTGGWCAQTTEKCPVNDAATCKAQGGEWCQSVAGTTASAGWCAQGVQSCPVNDEATCTAKGRSWCKNTSGSSGWCAATGSTCGGTTFSWPRDEKECTQYKGKWCQYSGGSSTTAISSGSCIMGIMKCSATTSCWDGSTGTSCPPMPSSKTECEAQKLSWCASSAYSTSGWCSKMPCAKEECEKKSYYWCESAATASTSASSGWCSESLCMKMPPAGKMTCPDGLTFASSLEDCPKADTLDDTKKCEDGTFIKKDAQCPSKKDEKVCTGGIHIPIDKECPPEKISDDQIKKNEELKRELIALLSGLESAFKKQGYDEALTQLGVVRESVQKVSVESMGAWDDLSTLKASVTALEVLRKERDHSQSKDAEREALQKKALEKLKSDMLSFQIKIIGIQDRMKNDKRKKISIPDGLEDRLEQIRRDVTKIANSSTYDEARFLTEQLAERMDDVNTLLDQLTRAEQLLSFAPLFTAMDTEIARRARTLKTFQNLPKASRETVSTLLTEAAKKVQDTKDALASARKGSYGEYDDPFDYLEQEVVFVLDDVDNDIDTIKARLNIRSFFSKAKVKLASYKRKVNRTPTPLPEVSQLLSTYEQKLNDLSKRNSEKISPTDKSLGKLIGEIVDIQDAIEKHLGLLKETSLEKRLRILKKEGSAQELELPELEQLVTRADSIRFFLTTHAPTVVYAGSAWERSYFAKR